MLENQLAFFFHPQRLEYANDFVRAYSATDDEQLLLFGILLSGPNGVGKSAVGVLTFLTCFARGLPVVYIPSARRWVNAAMYGNGHAYFLECFMAQNADLVAANPILSEALFSALQDGPLDSAMMTALQAALKIPGCPRIGVIVDEVQTITDLIARDRMGDTTLGDLDRVAVQYFKQVNHTYTFITLFTPLSSKGRPQQ